LSGYRKLSWQSSRDWRTPGSAAGCLDLLATTAHKIAKVFLKVKPGGHSAEVPAALAELQKS